MAQWRIVFDLILVVAQRVRCTMVGGRLQLRSLTPGIVCYSVLRFLHFYSRLLMQSAGSFRKHAARLAENASFLDADNWKTSQ